MEKSGKWHGHTRSTLRRRVGEEQDWRGKSVFRAHFLLLYWSSELFDRLWEDVRGHVCLCTHEWALHITVPHGQFLLGTWCFHQKNNCWEFVVVFVLFSCLQSLVRVVFPAIFLSYQPYNFIVIIRCGMSFDTHPGWCLCQADCLLICLTNGFRHFLVSFCLFLLTCEIFVSKEKAQIFSFPCLLLFKCI